MLVRTISRDFRNPTRNHDSHSDLGSAACQPSAEAGAGPVAERARAVSSTRGREALSGEASEVAIAVLHGRHRSPNVGGLLDSLEGGGVQSTHTPDTVTREEPYSPDKPARASSACTPTASPKGRERTALHGKRVTPSARSLSQRAAAHPHSREKTPMSSYGGGSGHSSGTASHGTHASP